MTGSCVDQIYCSSYSSDVGSSKNDLGGEKKVGEDETKLTYAPEWVQQCMGEPQGQGDSWTLGRVSHSGFQYFHPGKEKVLKRPAKQKE